LEKPKKYTSRDDALIKLQSYCSYQERCHQEVRSKLISLAIYGDDLEDIISQLIEDNFLDEERYARAFARGKFRIKSWGKVKIKMALKQKQVSEYCIRKAMTEINEAEYLNTLETILFKRTKTTSINQLPYKEKQKTIQWAMSRGYELNIILSILE